MLALGPVLNRRERCTRRLMAGWKRQGRLLKKGDVDAGMRNVGERKRGREEERKREEQLAPL